MIAAASRLGRSIVIAALCLGGVACSFREHSGLPSTTDASSQSPDETQDASADQVRLASDTAASGNPDTTSPGTSPDLGVSMDGQSPSDAPAPDAPRAPDTASPTPDTASPPPPDTAPPPPPPDSGTPKAANGAGCVQAGECQSGICSPDGVCCNRSCTAPCEACDIAGSRGTCSQVTSGQPHSKSPCGGTGVCAGACAAGSTQCSYPTGSCGTASCNGSSIITAGTCNMGSCGGGGTQPCPSPQTCQVTGSGPTCVCPSGGCNVGDTQCAPGGAGVQTCMSSGSCTVWGTAVPCQAPKVCRVSGNIASCQGNCKIQSAANRVPNGGFDRDLGGWASTPGDPDGAQWWAGDDVSGCQTSGVMRTKSSAFSPCFSVPPSTALDFGAALNAPDPISAGTGQARCTVTFYDDASCMGNNVGFASVKVSTAGWQRQSTAVATSADTMSAKVECRCFAELAFFDEIYLSPPPTAF